MYIHQQFVDDMWFFFFLKGLPGNLHKVERILQHFYEGYGAKLNLNKSIAIWASNHERNWTCRVDKGLKWLPTGEATNTWDILSGINYLNILRPKWCPNYIANLPHGYLSHFPWRGILWFLTKSLWLQSGTSPCVQIVYKRFSIGLRHCPYLYVVKLCW